MAISEEKAVNGTMVEVIQGSTYTDPSELPWIGKIGKVVKRDDIDDIKAVMVQFQPDQRPPGWEKQALEWFELKNLQVVEHLPD